MAQQFPQKWSSDELNQIKILYGRSNDLAQAFLADKMRYDKAYAQLKISTSDISPIVAVANRYEGRLGLLAVLRELNVSETGLRNAVEELPEDLRLKVSRLLVPNGVIERSVFESVFAYLLPTELTSDRQDPVLRRNHPHHSVNSDEWNKYLGRFYQLEGILNPAIRATTENWSGSCIDYKGNAKDAALRISPAVRESHKYFNMRITIDGRSGDFPTYAVTDEVKKEYSSTVRGNLGSRTAFHMKDVMTVDGLQRLLVVCGDLNEDEFSCGDRHPRLVCPMNP
jgi:hypothetical protein